MRQAEAAIERKTEKYVAHVKSLIEDQEILKVKYVGLEEKCKTGEESLLTIVSETDILIASQRKRIEEITKSNTKLRKAIDDKDDEMLRMKYNELKIEYDELVKSHLEKQNKLVSNYEQVLSAKNGELASVNNQIQKLQEIKGSKPTKLTRPDTTGDSFRIKPKGGSARNIDVNTYKCENPDCDSIGVDTIRCSICSTFVCENCHDISVSKAKTIFNKCKTVYFICKNCDKADLTNGEQNENSQTNIICEREKTIEKLHKKINDLVDQSPNQAQQIDIMIEKRFQAFEDRIDKTFSEKLASAYETINEKIKETNEKNVSIPDEIDHNYKSFKDVVKKNMPAASTPPSMREIITEDRNEQLVRERERKRRATNVIIHGVNESTEEDKHTNDKEYVKELLENVGLNVDPESIVRLGKNIDPNKCRPIKIKFKSPDEKDNMMSRLSNLKKAEDKFRKISITDDYTIEERQEIKKFVDEAKTRNLSEEGNFFWRIRGSPKIGMELRRVPKRPVS